MRKTFRLGAIASVIALATTTVVSLAGASPAQARNADGAVFTMTNAAAGNEVVAFTRDGDGQLELADTYATGGLGTGVPRLSSQGPVILTDNGDFLLVVNPGSDDLTTFAVGRNAELTHVDLEPSGGDRPVSVTVDDDLVYVLNANNIAAFRLSRDGELTPIANSSRPLSGIGTDPAQVQFSPRGDTLIVTEKMTNKIDVYAVNRYGYAFGPVVYDSNGITPFGLAFTGRREFAVTEAFEGELGEAAATSYSLGKKEGFHVVSPSVQSGEAEVCWIVISAKGDYAYVTNFRTGTVSSYYVGKGGELTLFEQIAARTSVGFGPRDNDLTDDGNIMYVIDILNPVIIGYEVNRDGTLTEVSSIHDGLPATFAGLAAE